MSSFAEIGTLIGLYHITGVVLSLPGGLIIRRIGDKNLCAIGLALMAGGGFVMAQSDSYAVAFAGRLASGMGATLFNLVITKMTTDWFARREIVLAMAVILSTWPFGIALGLFTEPRIADAFGWRAVMLLAATLCLVSLLLVALGYRVPPEQSQLAPASQAFGLPPWRVLAPVIAAGVMWGSFNAGLVTYFSFVPSFLARERRHDHGQCRRADKPGTLGRYGVDPIRWLRGAAHWPSLRHDRGVLRADRDGVGDDRCRRTAVRRVHPVRPGNRPAARCYHVAADPRSCAGAASGRVRRVLHLPLPVAGQRSCHRRLAARHWRRRRLRAVRHCVVPCAAALARALPNPLDAATK